MKVSGLLLILTLTLWSGCACLPTTCSIDQVPYFKTSLVHCSNTSLTAIPLDIPGNAESFTLSGICSITNVSYLPPLPRLRKLELHRNCIESFSWMSLRVLPNLRALCLSGNRLRHVKLDTVIGHLPKLRKIDLRFNKLASFSEHELGWPQVTHALINGNPFHCDCDLSWLIVKMACLQGCKRKDCCYRCSACFLDRGLKMGAHVCSSPRELNKLHLSNPLVLSNLTGCEAQQPTTKPTAMSLTSTVPTDETETTTQNENQSETENQLQRNETSMSIIPTGSAQTTKTSCLNNATGTTIKQEYGDKLPVLYISIPVIGTFLAFTAALCLIAFNIEYKLSCECLKGANMGADHSAPAHTASQIVDHTYSNPEEGLDGGDLAVTGGSQGTSPTTNHIYSVGEDMDTGTETTAPTTDDIYSIEEDFDNGKETTSTATKDTCSIEEGVSLRSGVVRLPRHRLTTPHLPTLGPNPGCPPLSHPMPESSLIFARIRALIAGRSADLWPGLRRGVKDWRFG
uniref:LRRCT domain-containing protein n=1 Tax=Branchiostoma floridae TaxID=7739 RepID=C3YEV3_BRAFL|eukprot:XP_002605187.1 hypothetical protein BRAFLDRAFT_80871 [Branchiostoma floridae]